MYYQNEIELTKKPNLGYNKDFHWRTIYVYNKKEQDYNHYNQWFGCKVNAKP